MRTRLLISVFLILAIVCPGSTHVKSTIPDAARLHLLLKKLTVVGNALYVGAHPDDENTAILATLSLGRKVRTGYLALNRGEGGQNLIGTEQGALLGLIRTQELLAARNVDKAEQFFTRAVDFGFSKSAEESLRFWGKDEVLADVVWVFRKFRPDVVITRFPSEGETHGHHLASAILAEEAFSAAGDPKKYPEQLKFVSVWKPKRIVWNRYTRGNQTITDEEKNTHAAMDVGEYNGLLGKSYSELAGIARSMHKSQGFGDAEDRGKFTQYFRHTAGDPAQKDLFEGIDLSWNRIDGAAEIGKILEQAADSFDPDHPAKSIPALLNAHRKMLAIKNNPWVEDKKQDLLEVIRGCAGLWLEAIAAENSAIPGSPITIDATAINRSPVPIRLDSVRLLPANTVDKAGASLPYNEPVTRKLQLSLPATTSYTQPYWLGEFNGKPFASVANPEWIGRAETPPALEVEFFISVSDSGHASDPPLRYKEPVLFRSVDPVRGEIYRDFVVAPEAAMNVQDPVVVFSDRSPKPIRVQVISGDSATRGEVRLVLPKGWSADPASHSVNFTAKGQVKILTFNVRPNNGAQTGEFRAQSLIQGREISRGKLLIDYPHIPVQTVFPPSTGRLVRVDIQKAGKNLGYIMGPGDAIPDALKQIGYQVTLLSDEDLLGQKLSMYDAILVGIRAYNTRQVLRDVQDKLMEYVNGGGTLVVQYQTSQDLISSTLGPYAFQISRRRVSVEDAPVSITRPEHSLLIFPNRITSKDFEGWVQERGLYFPDQWAPQYEIVLTSADPKEEALPGGILFARYGKGVYIYTSYSWFRQLPAGVPGAYRMFVNLISAGSAVTHKDAN